MSSTITRKIPAAVLAAALLLAIPGVWSLMRTDAAAASPLTPGSATSGLLATQDRVDFWRDRIAAPSDYLNRVHAGVALLELARQSGDSAVYALALNMADEALQANPSSVDARVLRAASLAAAHRFDEALEDAQLALRDQRESFQAHSVAGDALLELQRYAEAQVHLDALVAAQPQAPAVLARLAEFAWDTGDPRGAVSYGERALARANDAGLSAGELSFYAIRLARFRLDTGDAGGARELADAALEIAPEVPAVQSTLGLVHQATGDLEAAVEAFESAVELSPLREALTALVEIHSSLGNDGSAARFAEALDELGPALDLPAGL